MLSGMDGGAHLTARHAVIEEWPTEFREEDIELDENGFYTSHPMSRHGWLEVPYQVLDGSHIKVQNPSVQRQERPRTPLERFFSEDHRHEKIALMMRGPEEGVEAHRGSARKHGYGHGEDEYAPMNPMKRVANKNSPHWKPPSPFQPRLEVDGFHHLEGAGGDNYEDGAQLEAIRLASRIE